jgi:peptidylprolyl isomerase
MQKVKNGDFVQIHYTGTLEDDTPFDSSEGRGPLEFQVGGGAVIPGFNDAVLGMAVNEEKRVTLTPEQAYGFPREEAKREFPKEMLGDMQVEVGQELKFSTPRGPIIGRILEAEGEKFRVDFNHPLAGKTLVFQLKLVGISDTPTQAGCSCSSSDCGTGSDCGSGSGCSC